MATLHQLIETLRALDADPPPRPAEVGANLPLLLNAVEAGKVLSISRAKVLDLAARGQIPSLRVGGSVRIPRERLLAWIAEGAQDESLKGSRLPNWVRVDRSNEV